MRVVAETSGEVKQESDVENLSATDLLVLIQNKHDLAYLVKTKFSHDMLHAVRDTQGNNILHLALHNKNQNIFHYVINHGEAALLYQRNESGLTPIDIVYADIAKKGAAHDFAMLMLLDQVGADLEAAAPYQAIYDAFKTLPSYRQKFMLSKQPNPNKVVKAVSFNGGGAKGAAFMGAFGEAIKQKLIQPHDVKEFAGTSAGAITAGIFALGFDINRCTQELNDFKFDELMKTATSHAIQTTIDAYVKRWIEYYNQGYYFYLLTDMLKELSRASIFGSSIWNAMQDLLNTKTGIFKTDYLRETLARLIKEKIDTSIKDNIQGANQLANIKPEYITFNDFHIHPLIFRELTVYITNLTEGITEKWSADTAPNISVIDGIVTSASFPIFFEAVQKHEIIIKADGSRERVPLLVDGKPVICCDGGVLKNDPVDAFDKGSFNENALTFMLVGSAQKRQFEYNEKPDLAVVQSSVHVLTNLFKLMRGVERDTIHADIRNFSRIIYIDTKNVETLDFKQAKENLPLLTESGQDSVIDYKNRSTANGYSELSNTTIALLISYGVAKYSAGSIGQMVEINPGVILNASQILRVYAAASLDEIFMLRSIVNPNQRDVTGVSAMMIAQSKEMTRVILRLQQSGARRIEQAKIQEHQATLDQLPAYFNRGETFLQTALCDEDLSRHTAQVIEIEKLRAALAAKQQEVTELSSDYTLLDTAKTDLVSQISGEYAALTRVNTGLQTKYQFCRTSRDVVNAVEELKNHRDKLQKKKDTERKTDKVAGINDVITELNNNHSVSARRIVRDVAQQYPHFFAGVRSKTKSLCHKIIESEEKATQSKSL